jgi:hypothetical protein
MRDLNKDLQLLIADQTLNDLSDEYLAAKGHITHAEISDEHLAFDLMCGITFVESNIAREWLERAIKAESKNCQTCQWKKPVI